jgi:4-amino-4-deoxy-L-arabinose transferase-like glycosyltransferase
MGFNDDWSFAHIAREFAATGRLSYNGWPAMMLIPQIVWAAGFIKLFGFSFFALRASTVVLGLLLVPVLYRLGRGCGLTPQFAVFATLLIMLSPLFLPLAVSFMSDVPAFFFFVLCLYGGVQSWKASTAKACGRWAGLVVLAGVLSGLDRQIYWLAPLSFLPVAAWIQRRRKGAAMLLAAAWLSVVAVVAFFVPWYKAKPYSIDEHTLDAWKHATPGYLAFRTSHMVGQFAVTLALILLPLLAGYVIPGFGAATRKTAAFAMAGVLALGFVLVRFHPLPSMGNGLTEYGILGRQIIELGVKPVILGPVIRGLLTMVVVLSCAGCGLALWKQRGTAGARIGRDPAAPLLWLGLVFCAVWCLAILYRSASSAAPWFDRHLIALMPLAAVPLLRHYQTHIGQSVSRWSWALLALMALYGVATTHDALAAGRARLTAAHALERAGVPRTEILAGLEYDGWTQLETAGFINNSLIGNPAGAYRQVTCTGPGVVQLWYLGMMPAIRPRYFVTTSRLPGLEDAPAAPVDFTTWMPPARRNVFTQILPGGASAGCR